MQAPEQAAVKWFKQARRQLKKLASDDAVPIKEKRRMVINWLKDVKVHEPPWCYKKVVDEINVILRQSLVS